MSARTVAPRLHSSHRSQFSRTLLVLLALGAAAHACSIPVFRYALDRWHADKFRLEVSAADASDEKVAHFLRNFTDSTPLNLDIARVPENSRLLFPTGEPAWTGALPAQLAALIDSPARAEIVRRILDGENGVWVLVEAAPSPLSQSRSGAPPLQLLEKRLRYLEQVAQLPHIDPNDPTSKLGPGPALRVKFSTLRLPADDPAEQPFLKMLAGTKGPPTGAWLALVFGRGRVLGAWPAEGFGDEQIDEACLFLLGACSCEVKRLNPGWDLLLHADWDEKLRAIGFAPQPEQPAPSPLPEVVTIAPETVGQAPRLPGEDAAGGAPILQPLALAAAALLVLGGGLAWWSMRGKP